MSNLRIAATLSIDIYLAGIFYVHNLYINISNMFDEKCFFFFQLNIISWILGEECRYYQTYTRVCDWIPRRVSVEQDIMYVNISYEGSKVWKTEIEPVLNIPVQDRCNVYCRWHLLSLKPNYVFVKGCPSGNRIQYFWLLQSGNSLKSRTACKYEGDGGELIYCNIMYNNYYFEIKHIPVYLSKCVKHKIHFKTIF